MKSMYNLILILYAIFSLPKFFRKRQGGEKYSLTLSDVFGRGFPKMSHEGERVWIHAVSVGEVKVASTLLPFIRAKYPNAHFLVTCATKTGAERAKTLFPSETLVYIMPLDLSFIMKRIVRGIRPDLVFVSESDFWANFLREAKRYGARVFLINGKLSERSFKRYCLVPWFAESLFELFDGLFVQNEEYAERFTQLIPGAPVTITGNMKYDVEVSFQKSPFQNAVTFGSTHKAEEDLLLGVVAELHKAFPSLKIYFVPRHPERFHDVAEKMRRLELPFALYEQRNMAPIILVDVMGKLVELYGESKASVVAGSFDPSLEGHDIFEPIIAGSIPIFGPHMNAQKEMVDFVLSNRAGFQKDGAHLLETISELLVDENLFQEYQKRGITLLNELRGSSEKTWKAVAAT